MCLITFSYKTHPKYDLILAGNRDEFYERPTRPAQFWTDEGYPDILAGKDLEAGGTWFGIHKDGRWGAVTNYRDPKVKKEDPPSRGKLIMDYLTSDCSAVDYLHELAPTAQDYNGFNLLLWDNDHFYHYSNQSKRMSNIQAGIHGLSNALLDTAWPKVTLANQQLKRHLNDNKIDKNALFTILLDDTKAQEENLPVTGISRELEKAVSPIFIKTDQYGTRCSTLLLIHKNGTIDFTERSYKPGTSTIATEKHFII